MVIRVFYDYENGDILLQTEELYNILYQNMGPQHWWPADSNIEMMLELSLFKTPIGEMLI